jgi:hypothetical protein
MNGELPGGTGTLEGKPAYLAAMTRPYDRTWWLFPAVGTARAQPVPADGLVGGPLHAVHGGPPGAPCTFWPADTGNNDLTQE